MILQWMRKGLKFKEILLKYAKNIYHVQKSVFEGNLTELNLMKLKKELFKHIRDDRDSLIIFKSRDEKWLTKEFLGLIEDKTSNFF